MELAGGNEGIYRISEKNQVRAQHCLKRFGHVLFQRADLRADMDDLKVVAGIPLLEIQDRMQGGAVYAPGGAVQYTNIHTIYHLS